MISIIANTSTKTIALNRDSKAKMEEAYTQRRAQLPSLLIINNYFMQVGLAKRAFGQAIQMII